MDPVGDTTTSGAGRTACIRLANAAATGGQDTASGAGAAARAPFAERLYALTPHLAVAAEPGVLWADARGLHRLYSSATRWVAAVQGALSELGHDAVVVLGFSRIGTWALARALESPATRVLRTRAEERAALLRVPLAALPLDRHTQETMHMLGIVDVAGLAALSGAAVRERLGDDAWALQRLLRGEADDPTPARAQTLPLALALDLDHPTADAHTLLFLLRAPLQTLLNAAGRRGEQVAALHLDLRGERGGTVTHQVRPAVPTLAARLLLELLRLKLMDVGHDDLVAALALELDTIPLRPESGRLIHERPQRDLEAAARALARLRARLGETAVRLAQPWPAILPEGRFRLTPSLALALPQPPAAHDPPLVRRLQQPPQRLRDGPPAGAAAWALLADALGPIERCAGPYVVRGGWWRRPTERHYWFVHTLRQGVLWLYYDVRTGAWYQHGRVA